MSAFNSFKFVVVNMEMGLKGWHTLFSSPKKTATTIWLEPTFNHWLAYHSAKVRASNPREYAEEKSVILQFSKYHNIWSVPTL